MDAQQQAAAIIAAGEAREDDNFIVVSFVEPSENGPAESIPRTGWWSR